MLVASQNFLVGIVGNGITALSTAYHLKMLGIKDICIFSPLQPAQSWRHHGLVAGGHGENYTRLLHRLGAEDAAKVWGLGHTAFDSLKTYCQGEGVPWVQGRRLRFIVSEHEQREATQAVHALQAAGFSTVLRPAKDFIQVSTRVKSVQDDGDRAAWLESRVLGTVLKKHCADLHYTQGAKDFHITEQGKVQVVLENGKAVHCELLVMACHMGIPKMLPELKEALVSVLDQWQQGKATSSVVGLGDYCSANHGYEWWGGSADGAAILGGCRYLRPLAGIGAYPPVYMPRIEQELKKQLSSTFPLAAQYSWQPGCAVSDIYPCDELPVIGPLFGSERIYIATGYLGFGLPLAFLAGRFLAELISKGKSTLIPRLFAPERLRSLGE